MDTGTREWLLDQDPALRWQVERDLLDAPDEVWRATRARVTTEGYGARLLALQDPDGQWAGGAFFPADFSEHAPDAEGQPWTATTWSLSSLREWGVDASHLAGTAERLAAGCRWEYDDLPYWGGEVDVCINSWTLSNGLWLGADVDGLVDWFLDHRLPDGGWNCFWVDGARRSSFHSTLNALKGLLDHAVRTGDAGRTREARRAGEEYLLERRLHRRLSTGETVAPWALRPTYPPRAYYDVLNALDHFRAAAAHEGTPPDPRLAEAVAILREQQQPDGRWLQGPPHRGRTWFPVDVDEGEPSPWLTLQALRVLRWWDAEAG
ncbi:squalene cyclase [Nocardioides sp. ChNu-153]|uniref:squalene cyclase n=1 Tax=unclassified Nocardioides TaxID=2615069 RepID=UPI00240551D9|nr:MULTISPECIES: squalene cyclase [unclassified Nocardioides]MDF9714733.1 squalene cyclase [Nocardioides sp. ChNu-99]MDN7120139.1 squalene cyclase [Nocardioides sp. ChNu-153]